MALVLQPPRIPLVCSDAELIQRTGEGDRTAFEKLYQRYARPVFGLALRRLGDRGRAEGPGGGGGGAAGGVRLGVAVGADVHAGPRARRAVALRRRAQRDRRP